MSNTAMKKPRKPYAKPRIAIEEFTHNLFIANCQVNANRADWMDQLRFASFFDYMAVLRGKFFVQSMEECLEDVDSDYMTEDMDTLCYHTSSSPLFGS